MRRRRRRHSVDSEIPTSSTGDIAFLLIIFFMVTASFAVTKGLPFDLPEKQATDGAEENDAVLIEIRAGGAIVVDCTPMAAAEILDYLEPRLARNPAKVVVLYVHEGAQYQELVTVYEVLYAAPDRGIDEPNVQIPTPETIRRYEATFGFDPFKTHCDG